jgi:hypothetical protein
MKNLSKITTNFPIPLGHEDSYSYHIRSIECLIEKITDSIFYENQKEKNQAQNSDKEEDLILYFEKFAAEIPLIYCTPFDKHHRSISVVAICSTKHTHGVGRFMCDLYSRWLIPGKQIPIVNTRSLAFQFELYPQESFYLNELTLNITEMQDMALIKNNLPIVSKELKLNILAVQHARHVISLKPLSLDQKKILIQENITSLLDRSSKESEQSVFEYIHQLTTKFLAEEKVTQMKDQIAPLLDLKPTAFDRDIYSEMQQLVSQLKDNFTASRDLKYLNRIISYHYIFRKIVTNAITADPNKRYVSTKVLRTILRLEHISYPILGVLICINFINDNEIFEEKHLLKAIQSILPDYVMVPNSSIIERRGNKRVRSVYLEIEKEDKTAYSSLEIKELKKKIALEVKNRVEGLVHPVFVHRNEEEIMRSILDLSKQLKYIHDLPQVIVNFHKQTSFEISFIIILLRLKKSEECSLKEIFSQSSTILKFYNHDVKIVGILRKRYPKEAHVIELRLDKKQFLRKDFSLDLYKARLCVISEITRLIGDVRDYNGGMIAKQYEILSALKALLLDDGIHNDFLLENFFYSLTPNYMQSILSPFLLKKFFMMLLSVLEHEFNKDIFFMNTSIHEDYYILMLGAVKPSFKDLITDVIDNLQTSAHEISYSWVNIYDITCVGFLLRYDNPVEHQHFHETIFNTMKRWEETIKQRQEEVSSLSFLNEFVDYH